MIKVDQIIKTALAALLCLAVSSTAVFGQITASTSKVVQADMHVVVRSGDTLTSIVKRELGSLALWPEVVAANKLSAPDSMRPGDVIVIPWELLQLRNYARVIFFKGNVLLKRKDASETVNVKKGDKVYIGDSLKTGADGFVTLSFNGASQVNIQPESDLELKELDCYDVEAACEIKLKTLSGDMKVDVRNVGFSSPTKFSIETPYASAAVRGTEFDFSTRDGNILGVTKGIVEIFSNGLSNRIPLGKGVLAGEGRSIKTVFDLLGKPQYNQQPRVSIQDYISWQPIADAARYDVVIAASESLNDVIVSTSTEGLIVPAQSSPGRYFINTRGVAENGLMGFSSVKQIDQVRLNTDVPPGELDIELSGNTITIKPVSRYATEVHIGNRLEVVDDAEVLVEYQSRDISAGDSLEIPVDTSKDIYIISRSIINGNSVSAYGQLYEFEGTGK